MGKQKPPEPFQRCDANAEMDDKISPGENGNPPAQPHHDPSVPPPSPCNPPQLVGSSIGT